MPPPGKTKDAVITQLANDDCPIWLLPPLNSPYYVPDRGYILLLVIHQTYFDLARSAPVANIVQTSTPSFNLLALAL